MKLCPTCAGWGTVHNTHRIISCPTCGGTGSLQGAAAQASCGEPMIGRPGLVYRCGQCRDCESRINEDARRNSPASC